MLVTPLYQENKDITGTENMTNPPFLGAQLKKNVTICNLMTNTANPVIVKVYIF